LAKDSNNTAHATATNDVRHSFSARPDHSSPRLLSDHPWLTFLLPFIVYMVVGSFEPGPPKQAAVLPDGTQATPISNNWFGLEYRHYPIVYTVKIALTIAAMIFVAPGYRQFPFRVSALAIIVGVIGVVLWIELCKLGVEQRVVDQLGKDSKVVTLLGLGERPAFKPLQELGATPIWAYTFLAIRFIGLALVVPILEEFFLRGFLMRFVIRDDWWNVPFGTVTTTALIVGTLVPVIYHPEKLAALVWFSLVTGLMWRTRNIWDCVAAHAVTNLLLGIYVLTQQQWQLW
jgi:membrane protease YdiL (CAAX protease family)